MKKQVELYTALGLVGSGAWAMTSPETQTQTIGGLLIFGGVICFMEWIRYKPIDVKIMPRYGLVKFSHQLIVKIINNADFQLTVDEFGFTHGWFKKYGIGNIGVVNSKKEDSIIFLPLTIRQHDTGELIVRINHYQWQKETKKISGVYIKTSTNQFFYGKDKKFNRVVEDWKLKAKKELS